MSVRRYGPSCEPGGRPVMGGLLTTPPPTHDRCEGRWQHPRAIDGWDCPCECHQRPTPLALWQQADREHPDDMDALRDRYRELMIEHGHVIPAEPGTDHNLPCGWPGAR